MYVGLIGGRDEEGVGGVADGVLHVEVVAVAGCGEDADGVNLIAGVGHGRELHDVAEDGGVETVLGGVVRAGEFLGHGAVDRCEEVYVDLVLGIGRDNVGALLHDHEIGIADARGGSGDRRLNIGGRPADEVVADGGVGDHRNTRRNVSRCEVVDVLIVDQLAVCEIDDVEFVLHRFDVDGDRGGRHIEVVFAAVEGVDRVGVQVDALTVLVEDIDLGDDVAVVGLGGEDDLLADGVRRGVLDACLCAVVADRIEDRRILCVNRNVGGRHMEGDGVRGVVRVGHDVGVFISRGVEIQNVAVCKDVIDPRDLIAVVRRDGDGDLLLIVGGDPVLAQAVQLDHAVRLGRSVLVHGVGIFREDRGDDHMVSRHIEVVDAVLERDGDGDLAVVAGDGELGQMVAGPLDHAERDALADHGGAVGQILILLIQLVGGVLPDVALADELDPALGGVARVEALDDLIGVSRLIRPIGQSVARLDVDVVVMRRVGDRDRDVVADHREGIARAVLAEGAVRDGLEADAVVEARGDLGDIVAGDGRDVDDDVIALRDIEVVAVVAVDGVVACLGQVLDHVNTVELRDGVKIDLDMLRRHGEAEFVVVDAVLALLGAQDRLNDGLRAVQTDDRDSGDRPVALGGEPHKDVGARLGGELVALKQVVAVGAARGLEVLDVVHMAGLDREGQPLVGRADDQTLGDGVVRRVKGLAVDRKIFPPGEFIAGLFDLRDERRVEQLVMADGDDRQQRVIRVEEGDGVRRLNGDGLQRNVRSGHREQIAAAAVLLQDKRQRDHPVVPGETQHRMKHIARINGDNDRNALARVGIVRRVDAGMLRRSGKDREAALLGLGNDGDVGIRHPEGIQPVGIGLQLPDDRAQAVGIDQTDRAEAVALVRLHGEADLRSDGDALGRHTRDRAVLGRDRNVMRADLVGCEINGVLENVGRQRTGHDLVGFLVLVDPIEEGLAGDGRRARRGDLLPLADRLIAVENAGLGVEEADDTGGGLPDGGEVRVALDDVAGHCAIDDARGVLAPADEHIAVLFGDVGQRDRLAVTDVDDVRIVGTAAVEVEVQLVAVAGVDRSVDDQVVRVGGDTERLTGSDKAVERVAAPLHEGVAGTGGRSLRRDAVAALVDQNDVIEVAVVDELHGGLAGRNLRPDRAQEHVAGDGDGLSGVVDRAGFKLLPAAEQIARALGRVMQHMELAVAQIRDGLVVHALAAVGHGVGIGCPDGLKSHFTRLVRLDGEVLHAVVGIEIVAVLPAEEDLAGGSWVDRGDLGGLAVEGEISAVELSVADEAHQAAQSLIDLPDGREQYVMRGHGVLRTGRMQIAAPVDPALEDIAGQHRLCEHDCVAEGDVRQDIGRHIRRVVVEELNERAVGQHQDAFELGGVGIGAAIVGQIIGVYLELGVIGLVYRDRVEFLVRRIEPAGGGCAPADEGIALLDGRCRRGRRLAGLHIFKRIHLPVHKELHGVQVRLFHDRDGHVLGGHHEAIAVGIGHVVRLAAELAQRDRLARCGSGIEEEALVARLRIRADHDGVARLRLTVLRQDAQRDMLGVHKRDGVGVLLPLGVIGRAAERNGGVARDGRIALTEPAEEGVAGLGRLRRQTQRLAGDALIKLRVIERAVGDEFHKAVFRVVGENGVEGQVMRVAHQTVELRQKHLAVVALPAEEGLALGNAPGVFRNREIQSEGHLARVDQLIVGVVEADGIRRLLIDRIPTGVGRHILDLFADLDVLRPVRPIERVVAGLVRDHGREHEAALFHALLLDQIVVGIERQLAAHRRLVGKDADLQRVARRNGHLINGLLTGNGQQRGVAHGEHLVSEHHAVARKRGRVALVGIGREGQRAANERAVGACGGAVLLDVRHGDLICHPLRAKHKVFGDGRRKIAIPAVKGIAEPPDVRRGRDGLAVGNGVDAVDLAAQAVRP